MKKFTKSINIIAYLIIKTRYDKVECKARRWSTLITS